ncbi:DivIVA domain-containing protein [Kribbella sp. NPDC004536]|uniref:DivIVA domain-containing protein n=1 Tax=Kribbella sp. NPDC004536 TaxID=3364106 RepID=UPI00367B9BEA
MTNTSRRHGSRQYQTPDQIRTEIFRRRMRGLDQNEVFSYLDVLADQVQDTARDLSTSRAENERLQGELRRAQSELQRVQAELDEYEQAGDKVNEQIVQLFSQAQLVAEEMVQDVSRDARERIGQARAHERRIVEEAMDTAGQQVRSYAQSAQLRMQSIVDSFGTEIEQMGNEAGPETGRHQKDAWFDDMSDWQLRLRNERGPESPGPA